MCRTAEITKVGLHVVDGVTASIPVNKINKRSRKPTEFKKQVSGKQKYKQSKYCGRYHEMKQKNVQFTDKLVKSVINSTIMKINALHLPNMVPTSRRKITQWLSVTVQIRMTITSQTLWLA